MTAAVAAVMAPPQAAAPASPQFRAASSSTADARVEKLLAWLRAQSGVPPGCAASLAALADGAALAGVTSSLAAACGFQRAAMTAEVLGPEAAPSARLAAALRALDAAQGLALPAGADAEAQRVASGDPEAALRLLSALQAKATVLEWAQRAAAAGIVVAKPPPPSPAARDCVVAPQPPRATSLPPPVRRPATPPRQARTKPQSSSSSSSSSSSKGIAATAIAPARACRPEDWRLQPTALRALLRVPPARPAAARPQPHVQSPSVSVASAPVKSATASVSSSSRSPPPQTSRRRATPPREERRSAAYVQPPVPPLAVPPQRSLAVQELIASLARNATLEPLPPPPPLVEAVQQRVPRRMWAAPAPVIAPAIAPAAHSTPPASPSDDESDAQAVALHAWLMSLRLPACPAQASPHALAAAVAQGQLLLQLLSRLERMDLPGVSWQSAGGSETPRRAARAHSLRVALQVLRLQPSVPRRCLRSEAALLDGTDADVAMMLLRDVRDAAPYRWARAGLGAGRGGVSRAFAAEPYPSPRAPLGIAPAPRHAAASAPLPTARASQSQCHSAAQGSSC